MTEPLRIIPIVEGHGEVRAVPELIRRILADLPVTVDRPIRVPRATLLRKNSRELERTVEFAARKVRPTGAVLLLLDADDDCPKHLAPRLVRRIRAVVSDVPVGIVLAKREYEAWFLAAAESIRGRRGLPGDLESPENPESIRDAKGWLATRMESTRSYSETTDQPALTALFDLEQAAGRSPSFDKLVRELRRICPTPS